MKKCSKCKNTKAVASFHKNPSHKSGYGNQCKECYNAYRRADRLVNPDRYTDARLKYVYGISLVDYRALLKTQDNKCLGCKQQTKLVVDHCHTTGKVRGLLCNDCNSALGYTRDSVEILQNLIEYIERQQ